MKNMYAGAVVISMTFAAYVTGSEKQPQVPALTSEPTISTAFAAMTLARQQTSVESAATSGEAPTPMPLSFKPATLSIQQTEVTFRKPPLVKPQSVIEAEKAAAEKTAS